MIYASFPYKITSVPIFGKLLTST